MVAAPVGKRTGLNPSGPHGPPDAVLVGLVGRGIQLSRTPRMHEVEGARHGLRYVYRLFDTDAMDAPVPSLADILGAAELCGFAGLNITYPYKMDVVGLLDELSENAEKVGAVNTVVFRDGRRIGHNTDLWGFAESFRRNMAGAKRGRVLLIGAGGAGVAVSHALLDCGVETLLIADSDAGRAGALAEKLQGRYGNARVSVPTDIRSAAEQRLDGVVNATPVGMAKSPGTPFPTALLSEPMWVADIVYFPLETELLRTAREMGCRVLPGSGMAVFQAVRAFELFTGIRPDSARMKATLDAMGQ